MVYKVFEYFVAQVVAAAIKNAKRKTHKKTKKNKESFRKKCTLRIWNTVVLKCSKVEWNLI